MDIADHRGIGPRLWSTTQAVSRAFDRVLADAGGSRSVWFILLALHEEPPPATQRELAKRIELREATLTHHLHTMEEAGLVARVRGMQNRRIVRVEVTETGRALYQRLLAAALAFDDGLHRTLGDDEAVFMRALTVLHDALGDRGRVPPPAAP